MGSVKIINVQKNDSFEEVFASFSLAKANEIILIFPKGTIFGRNFSYFHAIKEESNRSGKTVSVMSSDPIIAQLAEDNEIPILRNTSSKSEAVADLAVAKKVVPAMPEPVKKIKDIITNESDTELKVKASNEVEQKIQINGADEVPQMTVEKLIENQVQTEPVQPEVEQPTQQPAQQTPEPNQQVTVNSNYFSQAPKQQVTDIEKLWEEEEKRQAADSPPKPKSKISKKFIFIPSILGFGGLCLILYLVLGSANVTLKPKMQDVNFNINITASVEEQSVNVDFKTIPGQKFVVTKEVNGSYPTSSTKEVVQKATGKIKIYNKTSEDQRLVATTRFETKDGLIFRIPDSVNVPANGSIESKVNADVAGKEYNIGPSSFTVPGFKGSSKYDLFYAESSEPMTGGFVGKSNTVVESDYANAKEDLEKKAKEEAEADIRSQIGDLKYLEPFAIFISQPSVNANIGEAADTLNMSVAASASVLAFRQEDVDSLLDEYLYQNGGLQLTKEKMKIDYNLVSNGNAGNKLKIEISVSGSAARKLDIDKIRSDVKGMSKNEFVDYFSSSAEEVDTAKVVLSPFWVFKIPNDADRIHIIVDLE